MPAPGDVVGKKYRIEEWLGQGGMGAVFRATQLLSEKPVALKWMLRPASHPQARLRFLREARAAGRIHHPNVVDIYDVGEEAEFDFLVMELLRGESLRARLDRGPLSVGEAVDMLLPAMLGVAAAHRAGVIHRDLKPDNVFLCERADVPHSEAKVLDFGISQITSADVGDSITRDGAVLGTPSYMSPEQLNDSITRDGAVLGTPSYMSPEQLNDARSVDARTDVYAMGVIFHEAITGRLPACGESDASLPRGFEQVLLRAIARDRDLRYPDMESFVAAVRPFGTRQVTVQADVRVPLPARKGRLVTALALALAAIWLLVFWMGRDTSTGPRSATSPVAAVRASSGPAAALAPALPRSDDEETAKAAELVREPIAIAAEPVPPPPAEPAPPARPDGARRPARTRPRTPAVPAAGAQVARSGTISLDDM